VLGALMLLLLAVPTAALIHEQAHVASFAMVAAVPLLSGAQNLGVSQMQRSGRFWPAAAADSGGAVLGVMAATAAALVVPDHRAILWGLAVQTGGAVALSHILARGVPYRVSFDTVRIRETLRFGLPLLINGIALAVAYQLDRMIVGAWLGVVALGVYGLCTTLLLQPVTLLLRLATTTLQPRLSSVWHTDRLGAFRVLARRIGGGICILACGGAVAAACLGAPTLRLIFGASFSASDLFFVVMAAVVLIRMGRGSLNLFGLAIGRTSDLMISNVAGSAALPLMIAILAVSPHLESAVCAGLCGEIVGWLVADLRLRRHCPEACRAVMRGLALSGTLLILVSVWVCTCSPSIAMRVTVAVAALIFIIPGLATQLPERALRTLNAEPR
jgi:O-antigen/teichoic acid export membrane protein